MNALLLAITAACNAYAAFVSYQREKEIDELEDEMSRLAAIGDAASELRLELLSIRKQRKLGKQIQSV